MTKTLTIVFVAAAVAASAGAAMVLHQRDAKTAATLPTDSYTAAATRSDIVEAVSATGPVASNLDVQIKCRAYGEVIKLPFDISDKVKKGDLLIQLDQKDEKVLYDQAVVTLEQSQSKLKEAQETERMGELDLKTATEQADANIISAQVKETNLQKLAARQQQLLTQTLAAPQDFETAQTNAAQAVADLEAAKVAKEELKSQEVALEVKKEDVELARQQVELDTISLQNAKQQMDYTTVVSPMDGVVSDLETQMGMIISSAISNVGGGTSVMTISDMSHIFVLASVDESDIGGVVVGQDVDITADAFPGKHFSGKVVRIATQGVNTSNVVTFEVKIDVTSDNKALLKPQMTANVEIIESSEHDVITVPMMAIVRKQQKTFVTIVKPDGSTEDREVEIGINDGENQEIVSGLSGGEQVLVFKGDSNSSWSNTGRKIPTSAAMPGRGKR
ncbi:MAG TPA: efflux RND transporter periplasmic adaptor subunit [Tepidisphaeraceae bacterium]|jgi:HlyD family secretion protein|nr:efflux RND transporter periplasmic adaptor subunit [Tepidisphaeraceae bacterium]